MSNPELFIVVDKGVCTACGSCATWSPDVFGYDQLSLGENRLDGNTGTLPIPEVVIDDALPTLVHCPAKAIKMSDKPFVNFQPTPEFGTESPDNPNINYELADNEITVNEFAVGGSCCSTTPQSTGGGCGCGPKPTKSNDACGCGGNCSCGTKPVSSGCGCSSDSDDACGCGGNCTCGD